MSWRKCQGCPRQVLSPRRSCVNCNTCRKSSTNPIVLALRKQVIDHLGGKCVECGEDRLGCLDVDHVDVDGRRHRADLKRQHYQNYKGGYQIYYWLIDNNFNTGYRLQLLCRSCHGKKHSYYGWGRRGR